MSICLLIVCLLICQYNINLSSLANVSRHTSFHDVNANNTSSGLREKVILNNFAAKIW